MKHLYIFIPLLLARLAAPGDVSRISAGQFFRLEREAGKYRGGTDALPDQALAPIASGLCFKTEAGGRCRLCQSL